MHTQQRKSAEKATAKMYCIVLNGKKDFFPMEIDYGEFFNFNGNKCTHGNKTNITKNARVSFDFRILPKSKYQFTNKKTSVTSKKKFVIGEYYKASENF